MAFHRRDPEKIRQSLLHWLRRKFVDAKEIALSLPVAPEAGGSSETFFLRADIVGPAIDRHEDWVLRIEASDYRIYEQPSIDRQYLAMRALGKNTSTPVPKVVFLEQDKSIFGEPFFLMEKVEGTVPRDRFHSEGLFLQASAAERETMWLSAIEAMAALHTADVRDYLFLDRPALGATALDQEVAVWDSYSRWIGLQPAPVYERARRWLEENMPRRQPPGLAWGDARLGNTIYRDHACVALLDWETVSLSGAETDLGWWIFYDWLVSEGHGLPRLEGLPDTAATLEYWAKLVGRHPNAIEWFQVFAAWRFSLIHDRALHLIRLNGLQVVGLPDPNPIHQYLTKLTV